MESLSRPRHGRNHSTSSILSNKKLSGSNGFSPKNAYDDVFSGRRKFGASKFSSRIEDYSEIFGGSEGSRACSIPFIDLSAVEETDDVRSSKLEYSQIFGGFRDEDVGVSYDEMLAEPRSPAKIVSSSKRSNQLNNSRERPEFSHVASTQSFDGVKQFNMSYHKSAQRSDNGTNGTTHIAQLHAVPGFTYFVDGKIPLQKAKHDQSVPAVKTDVYRDTNFSKRTMEGKDYRKVVSHLIKEQKSEGAVKFKNGSSHARPNSDDELFHTYDVNLKTHLPKVSPPSSLPPKLFSSNGIPKRSVASKSEGPKSGSFDCSSVCSDEELDVNSAAAVSSAALRKAIERAQESIRMAKESMERSKVGLRSHSKPSSKGGLEVKERKESKVAGEAKGTKEKNPKGTVMQSGRVAPEFHEETMNKVKSAEEREVLKQTSEQANSGNHRTESVNTDECETKDMKAGKVILEMHEGNVKRAVERTFEWEDVEKKLKVNVPQDSEDGNILQPTQEVHEKETQKKEDAEVKERAFFEQERHEKILIESKEPAENEKRFECRGREDESQGNQEEIIEQVVNERILEDDQEERENGNKIQDEIGKRLNEPCGLLDCESKLKESDEIGSNEEKRNDSCEGEENEKRLDQVFELEVDLDDKTQDDIHAEREAEKKVKEDYTWEGYEKTHVEAYAYEETESVQSETGKTENSEKIHMTTEAVKDEKTHDAADSLSGTQKACRYEENGNMAGVGQDVNTCEEIEKLVEVTKPFCEFREDETVPEPLEVIYESEKEETCKAADLVESAAENEMKDATDVFLFDGNLEDFGLIYASIAQKQIEQNDNGFELASNTENSISSDESEDNKSQFEDAEMAFDQEEESAHEELSQPSNKFNGEEETIDIDEEIKACQNTEKNKENLSETFDVEDEETEESREKEVKEAEVAFDQVQDKINVDGAHEERQWVEIEKKKEEFEPSIVFLKGEDKIADIDENNEENLSETSVEDGETEESVEKEVKDSEVAFDQEQDKINVDEAHEERQWVEIEKKKEAFEPSCVFFEGEDKTVEIDEKNEENPYKNFAVDGQETKEIVEREVKVEKEHLRKVDETNMREREREKQRIAVERAIREARERAFADARERAERAAVERATAEARQRVMAETREKFEKACAGAKSSTEKASIDAKIRSERAAVERATAEARERALEKALSQKTTSERFSGASRDNVMRQSSSANDSQRVDTSNTESAQRRKARLERHQRIMERAAKALGEKNRRDLLAQKEQAEKNRLAGALDADVKRWSSGKEGNLRALLSTLQYILGPDSGWQPVSLTEIVTTNAVKKAYRRATLYVHPDKLQQRGASIRQKYICEKVFDLLKAAWNKFNSEER